MIAVQGHAVTQLNTLVRVSVEDYNADREAVRKGWLDRIERSPAHLQAYFRGEIEDSTEALEFGQLVHCFVLEPDMVHARYYREPKADRRTIVGKNLIAETAAANPGKLGFKPETFDLGMKLRDAVYAHRAAKALLSAEGDFEQSVFWKNGDTSELCKCRYDFAAPRKAFAVDVKTTEDASPNAFARSIWTYRYDVAAHHYTEPTEFRFVLIAVEKKSPFCVACYAISDEILRVGAKRRLPNLRTYAECKASGRWEGYGDRIQHIKLPPWAKV